MSPTCSLRTQGGRFPVQWQYFQLAIDFFQFNQNSTIYTDLIIIRHLQCPNNPPVPHMLAEDLGPWFPVWWQYCLISMDFFHFYQNWIIYIDLAVIRPFQWPFNPLSPTYSVRPRALDSQCNGNIATFRWISPILCNRHPTPKIPKLTLSPTCSLRTQGPWFPM